MHCGGHGRKARNLGKRKVLNTLKSYHVSNYLGLIIFYIGVLNFHIYWKFGCSVASAMSGSMNGPLSFFRLTIFSNHKGWLLLSNSQDSIICSTVSNHFSSLVCTCLHSHRRQGEIRFKKGPGGEDRGRGGEENKGEEEKGK